MAKDPRKPQKTLPHLISTIRGSVPPIHPAATPFVAGCIIVGLGGFKWRLARWLGFGGALACALFFRNPHRVTPTEPGVVVSPADGQVCAIDEAVPPAELGLGPNPMQRVAIYLSILDVHTQKAPVSGVVTRVRHTSGSFLPADDPFVPERNERNAIVIDTGAVQIAVVQMAGILARRIVCDVAAFDQVSVGETWGLIRFGSRVDTYMPLGTPAPVLLGQRVVGGETVIGRLS